jgi:hypothetical protein
MQSDRTLSAIALFPPLISSAFAITALAHCESCATDVRMLRERREHRANEAKRSEHECRINAAMQQRSGTQRKRSTERLQCENKGNALQRQTRLNKILGKKSPWRAVESAFLSAGKKVSLTVAWTAEWTEEQTERMREEPQAGS